MFSIEFTDLPDWLKEKYDQEKVERFVRFWMWVNGMRTTSFKEQKFTNIVIRGTFDALCKFIADNDERFLNKYAHKEEFDA